MNTNFTFKLIFLFCITLFTTTTFAQIVWDGGGDGTSWNDAANWQGDMVPPADSLVDFKDDVVVTGTAAIMPPRITVKSGATVTLDLDLTVGNGVTNEHSFVISGNSTLILGVAGNNRTFTAMAPVTKHGVSVGGGVENASFVVAEGSTLNIPQALTGMNIANPTTTITNNGTINIGTTVNNGIKSNASFTNNGDITIADLTVRGLQLTGGTFENNGTITTNKTGNDAIEILMGSVLTNNGTINTNLKDAAGSSVAGISVGGSGQAGEFINGPNGMIIGDAGTDTLARSIFIDTMGVFTNFGNITLENGNDASRLYTRGTTVNEMNGVLDVTDGKVNVALGSFTNNGLIISTRGTSGVSTSEGATATNNGFFDYDNNNFSSGSGVITDNGINLNSAEQTNISAGGTCLIDLAEAAYEWFDGTQSIGVADASGRLTFPANSIDADPVTLTTSVAGVSIVVSDVCPEALGTSSIFTPIEITQLSIYPTLVTTQQELTIDLSSVKTEVMFFDIIDMNGQILETFSTFAGNPVQVKVGHFAPGVYVLKSSFNSIPMVGRFMIGQ